MIRIACSLQSSNAALLCLRDGFRRVPYRCKTSSKDGNPLQQQQQIKQTEKKVKKVVSPKKDLSIQFQNQIKKLQKKGALRKDLPPTVTLKQIKKELQLNEKLYKQMKEDAKHKLQILQSLKQSVNKQQKKPDTMKVTVIQVGESKVSQVQKQATRVDGRTLKAAITGYPTPSEGSTVAATPEPAIEVPQGSMSSSTTHTPAISNFPSENATEEAFKNSSLLHSKNCGEPPTESALNHLNLNTFHTNAEDIPDRQNKPNRRKKSTLTNTQPTYAELWKVYQDLKTNNHVSQQSTDAPAASSSAPDALSTSTSKMNVNSLPDSTNTSNIAKKSVRLNELPQEMPQTEMTMPVSVLKAIMRDEPTPSSPSPAPTLPPQKKERSSKKEKDEQLKKEKHLEIKRLRQLHKQAKFNKELRGYLSVCERLGFVNRVSMSIELYNRKHGLSVTSLAAYNIAIQGHLEKGPLLRALAIKSWLQPMNLSPDATTYALLLAAFHRLAASPVTGAVDPNKPMPRLNFWDMSYHPNAHHVGEHFIKSNIQSIIEEMQQQGLSLDAMFQQCDVVRNIREHSLEAVRWLHPDYTPRPLHMKRTPGYTTPLLQSLNKDLNYSLDCSQPTDPRSPFYVSPEAIQEQFQMELEGDVSIPSVQPGSKDSEQLRLEAWQQKWRKSVHAMLTTKMDHLEKTFRDSNDSTLGRSLFPYLAVLPKEKIIDIMFSEVAAVAGAGKHYCQPQSHLHHRLGRRIFTAFISRYKAETGVLDKLQLVYSQYAHLYCNDTTRDACTRVLLLQVASAQQGGPNLDHKPPEWPSYILQELGGILWGILLKSIVVWKPGAKNRTPCFVEVDKIGGYENTLEIQPDKFLCQLYSHSSTLTFSTTELPMLCPPLPWTSVSSGGYLMLPVPMVRVANQQAGQLQNQRLKECPSEQMAPYFDGLNKLAYTPWRINQPMLDLVTEIFKSNSGPELDVAQHPSVCLPPVPCPPTAPREQLNEYKRLQYEYYKTRNEMYSLWCTSLYKISIAQHYRDRVFWFPHNLDFRGRAYPCPPHLSYIDSDLFRSLLHFAEAKPLGQDGLNWLKTHVINLTGLKKHNSMADRLQYCDEIMPEISDSALKPLTGNRWWTRSDEPWQTLAACKELHAALQSPDPLQFESRLPIHQDGSCNGLQHYAALGRDTEGAISVNLAPGDTPQDVYARVSELVEKQRARDARNPSSKHHVIACALEGQIKRKVVKQTVMTSVYGVTRFGALHQIAKQLKDLDGFPPHLVFPAASYLARSTFSSLETMFQATKLIQDWLTDLAGIISKVCVRGVDWVTPLGLPIVQPYYKNTSVKKMLALKVPLSQLQQLQSPNALKQRNAFPPNYIHSLDASHMILTALYCHHHGLTFTSVHDCYWTHAATVDKMNEMCREQFVSLHSEPLLTQLSEGLQKQYGYSYDVDFTHDGSSSDAAKYRTNHMLGAVPSLGDFDIELVKKSRFFFS